MSTWKPRVLETPMDGVRSCATVGVDIRIAKNPEEPSPQVGTRGELRLRGDRTRVGLLDEVLRVGVASREISRDASAAATKVRWGAARIECL
jgi:hypothetical protein